MRFANGVQVVLQFAEQDGTPAMNVLTLNGKNLDRRWVKRIVRKFCKQELGFTPRAKTIKKLLCSDLCTPLRKMTQRDMDELVLRMEQGGE